MPSHDEWIVQSKSLSVAGRHMKAFSERRLTYDSDALNAVLGILDHLAESDEDPVYHIWGVPLALYSREGLSTSSRRVSYEIALNWYHEQPCRRRSGFPTWSSIAWDGPAQYSYQDQPMVPDDIEIRILRSEGSESLEDYVESGCVRRDSGSGEAPARLGLIQATTVPIEMVFIDGELNGAKLRLANDLDVISHVCLDEAGRIGQGTLLGVIIYRDYSSKRLLILVLTRNGEIYERVGFIIFDEDDIELYKFKHSRVRDRTTGEAITDAQELKRNLERPVRFISESRQDIILG